MELAGEYQPASVARIRITVAALESTFDQFAAEGAV
jgi:hypothetical protein